MGSRSQPTVPTVVLAARVARDEVVVDDDFNANAHANADDDDACSDVVAFA